MNENEPYYDSERGVDAPGPRSVYVNESCIRKTNHAPFEAVGKTPRMLRGSSTDRSRLDEIHSALSKRGPVRVELLDYRREGTRYWVEMGAAGSQIL